MDRRGFLKSVFVAPLAAALGALGLWRKPSVDEGLAKFGRDVFWRELGGDPMKAEIGGWDLANKPEGDFAADYAENFRRVYDECWKGLDRPGVRQPIFFTPRDTGSRSGMEVAT